VDWEPLIQQYTAMVLNTAYRVVGNLADAEDVTQQVFLEVFEKRLQPKVNWEALLRRVAVRRAIDALRRRPSFELIESAAGLAITQSPEHELLLAEEEALLRLALSHLPAREAQVFCLHYFEDLDNERMASVLGIPPSAVAVALSRAKSKLRNSMRLVTNGGTDA
jgi:RNA polymerase sigma-70 factor, ECF subfamily